MPTGVASLVLHKWSGQDLSFSFDPLKRRRIVLVVTDDDGSLYCGRAVQELTAQFTLCN